MTCLIEVRQYQLLFGDHLVLMNASPTSPDAHADLIIREPVARTFDQVMDELRARGAVSA